MTCIAIKGDTIAADSRLTFETTPATCEKIFRIRGLLVGVAGEGKGLNDYLAYFRGNCKSPESFDFEDAHALVLCPARGILLYSESAYPVALQEPYFAIGSGAGVALGALHAGKSVTEAIEAAIRWDTGCGGPVQSLTLRRKRKSA